VPRETLVRHRCPVRAGGPPNQFTTWRYIMAKRGRKKRDRKHSKANHGKRPNS